MLIRFLLKIFLSLIFSNSHPQSIMNADVKIQEKTFTYKYVDKVSIKAVLFQSAEDDALRPVIIWIHGGGLIFGSRTDLPEEQKKLYINAGYSIVSIDYRLAPETKLPEIVKDVTDAVEWVQQNGLDSLRINTSKVFVIGHSAGAYLALLSGYFLKKPPQAIVSFYGYGDIQSDWYNKPDSFYLAQTLISDHEAKKMIFDQVITSAPASDRYNLYLYTRQKGIWPLFVSGHDRLKERDWLKKYCPLKNINASYPPVLFIHGDKDMDVPFEQSVLMNNELKLKKVDHKFIRVTGSGHVFDVFEGGLSNPNISKVFMEVIAFLKSKS